MSASTKLKHWKFVRITVRRWPSAIRWHPFSFRQVFKSHKLARLCCRYWPFDRGFPTIRLGFSKFYGAPTFDLGRYAISIEV